VNKKKKIPKPPFYFFRGVLFFEPPSSLLASPSPGQTKPHSRAEELCPVYTAYTGDMSVTRDSFPAFYHRTDLAPT